MYGHLGARRIEGDGPPFVIYHEVPVADEPFDIEVCAPVAGAVDPPPGWQALQLPAGSFVTLLHVGPYDTVASAYDTLTGWIADHDLAVAGAPREVYLSPPETPPAQIRTIIEFPVDQRGRSSRLTGAGCARGPARRYDRAGRSGSLRQRSPRP